MRVSVVMAAYNAEPFIGEAIESVLAQTLTDLELIVVDDGSTDATGDRISSYASNDARVRSLSQDHQGSSAALNEGIAAAQSDWIAILDADDIALPRRLERQLAAASDAPHVVAWGAFAYTISSTGRALGVSRMGATTEPDLDRLRANGRFVAVIHSTAVMKKSVLLEAGAYDPRILGAPDTDLFDRMAAYGPVLAVPEPLVLWRIHGTSVRSSSFWRVAVDRHFVEARNKARIGGEPAPSLDEFLTEWRGRPLHRRLAAARRDYGRLCLRRVGRHVGERRYVRAASWLVAAFALRPRVTARVLWTRRLSGDSRTELQALREETRTEPGAPRRARP